MDLITMLIANLDWFAGGAELIGLTLVGNKRRLGFILNILCCLTWIYIGWTRGIPGITLVAVPAVFINARNWFRWRTIR